MTAQSRALRAIRLCLRRRYRRRLLCYLFRAKTLKISLLKISLLKILLLVPFAAFPWRT